MLAALCELRRAAILGLALGGAFQVSAEPLRVLPLGDSITAGDAILDTLKADPAKFVAIVASKVPGEVELTNSSYVIVAPKAAASTEEWLQSLSVRRPDETVQ